MSTHVIDVDALSRRLGVPLDHDDPEGSIKLVIDTLKRNANIGDRVEARLDSLGGGTGRTKDVPFSREIQQDLASSHLAGASRPNLKGGDRAHPAHMFERLKTIGYAPPMRRVMSLPAQDEGELAVANWWDSCVLIGKLKGCGPRGTETYARGLQCSSGLAGEVETWQKDATNPLSSDGSAGHGSDFMHTDFSGQLWEDLRLECKLASIFSQLEMTSLTYKSPYTTGSATAYLTSQAVNLTPTHPTTGATSMTAAGFGCAIECSLEFEEDSAVAAMPMIKRDVVMTLQEATENAILNGDESNPSFDYETDATKPVFAFNGIRHDTLAASLATDISTFNTAALFGIRKSLGRYGVNPDRLAWIVGPVGYHNMLALTECLTVQNYGSAATVVTGELGKFGGIPIVCSGQMKDNDLSHAGVASSTINDSALHLVFRDHFIWGTRRKITLDADKFVLGDYQVVVAKMRACFAPRIALSSTYTCAWTGYNFT